MLQVVKAIWNHQHVRLVGMAVVHHVVTAQHHQHAQHVVMDVAHHAVTTHHHQHAQHVVMDVGRLVVTMQRHRVLVVLPNVLQRVKARHNNPVPIVLQIVATDVVALVKLIVRAVVE